jgi:hypothetical protein
MGIRPSHASRSLKEFPAFPCRRSAMILRYYWSIASTAFRWCQRVRPESLWCMKYQQVCLLLIIWCDQAMRMRCRRYWRTRIIEEINIRFP